MSALIIGTILALAALAFVLYPVLAGSGPRPPSRPAEEALTETAVDALREIEFDRATGKLSDADYTTLKHTYTERALAELRAAPAEQPDVAEAVVLAYRARRGSCAVHGPRPERDALYCSECGRYLAGACAACGTTVTEPAARFCTGCGATLAA
jgi:cytochrome c-type biogenesis protein CcmI